MPIDASSVRSTVTLEYNGKAEHQVKLAPRSKGAKPFIVTLKPGDNVIPLPIFHEFGHHQPTADLIVSGAIVPVCRDHVWRDGETHCRDCGHSPESAEAHEKAKQAAPMPSASIQTASI